MLLTTTSEFEPSSVLLARGLLSPRAAVEGAVAIVERGGRTGGLAVDQGDAAGSWFVKEGGSGPRGEAMAREARILAHLSRSPGMAARVPRLHSFDPETHLIVQHLVRGTCLRDLAASGPVGPEVMADLASAVAALHAARGRDDLALGDADVAWALELHRPRVADLAWLSAASLELLRALQRQAETCGHLDQARRGWRAETLVHADLRWDNLIAGSASGREAVIIVDWESAGLGDAAWDVGCVLAELLSDWIVSMPPSGGAPAGLLASAARRDLGSIHGQARAFWTAYTAQGSGRDAAELLGRSTAFAGVRLLQLGIEVAQHRSRPNRRAVAHMQVGCNVLAEPWRAADVLLGLSP